MKDLKSRKVKNLEARIKQLEGDLKFEKSCVVEVEIKLKASEKAVGRLAEALNTMRDLSGKEADRLERIVELLVRGKRKEGDPRERPMTPYEVEHPSNRDKHNF